MTVLTDLWQLFFPRCCLLCGKRLLKGEEHACFRCLVSLPRTHLQKENELEKSLWGKLPIERANAFLFYAKGGDVRKLLFELKYYGNADLGHFLGRCMASELIPSGFFKDIDCIIPVPLHVRRQRKRGYNQSELLAEGIASVTHVPLSKHLLVRSKDIETQTHKGNYERWENVREVFECLSPEELKNKHILLVDDVLTTGATIVACSDALAKIPGLRISVLTLAWAGNT
jgi:ComF family protein